MTGRYSVYFVKVTLPI